MFIIYGFRDEICFSRSEPTLSQAKYHVALRFELICSINLAYLPLKSSAYGYWISSELKAAPQFPHKAYFTLKPFMLYIQTLEPSIQ